MKYGGIERLVYEFSKELVKTHDVTVMGRTDSVYPEGVELLGTMSDDTDIYFRWEALMHQSYSHILRGFDVIHDFSHQHLASKCTPNLPSLNIFWHAPSVAHFLKSPYNIIAISKWAEREFTTYYRQKAKYQDTILIDTGQFKPTLEKRGDRFLSLGAITPRKGHLEALNFCKKAGVPLDVVGKKDGSELSYYQKVLELSEKPPNRFLGEIDDGVKVSLYHSAKALLYPSQEAEVSNHKLQEAMLCGCPVIVSKIGALPEIVTDGADGFLCSNEENFIYAINNVDKLNPSKTYNTLVTKYAPPNVVGRYVKLYEKVANGMRW